MNAWTESEKQLLIEGRRDGRPVTELAAQLPHPLSSVYAMAGKLCRVQEKLPLDEAAREAVTRLFRDGWPADEIARRTGRTSASIRWALKELGLRRGRSVVWTEEDDGKLEGVIAAGGGIVQAMPLFPGRLRANVITRLDALRRRKEAKAPVTDRLARFDAELVEAVRRNFVDRTEEGVAFVEARMDAETIAVAFETGSDVVRKVAAMLGRSFSPRWTDEQHALLLKAAARFETPADVVRFLAPRLGRPDEAVRSRLKALGIRVVGREAFERPERAPRARDVAEPVSRPAVVERDRAADRPASRRGVNFRRPAARTAPPSQEELKRMTAEFMARRGTGRSAPGDLREELVRALRVRGYVVLRQDGGFQVDGRTFVEDVEGLARFAEMRGVSVGSKEARAT